MNSQFAIISGTPPVFSQPLPVGQLYMPEWSRFERAMTGIFERRWYTNQGPLVQQFEEALQDFLGVKHIICVTNATIGLLMSAEGLELSGSVIVPSHTFVATAQSLVWCGLKPLFCDVNPTTQQLDPAKVDKLLSEHKDVSAVLGVHLWGGACEVRVLQDLCSRAGVALYFDSAHAFGCAIEDRRIGHFGKLEVFSFHATKVLSATEGGCIATNDDDLAARLRNIRSSYGAGRPMAVTKTANGRMSEAQAAIGRLNLEDYSSIRARNQELFEIYKARLKDIAGVEMYCPTGVSCSNFQYVACQLNSDMFGMSRNHLVDILTAENVIARRYFVPGTHRTTGFTHYAPSCPRALAVTETLTQNGFQLPIGARVDTKAVEKICSLIARIRENAQDLDRHLRRKISCA